MNNALLIVRENSLAHYSKIVYILSMLLINKKRLLLSFTLFTAILLLTMLLSNTSSPVHAAPTGNMEHALYREIVDFSLEFLHDNVTPIFDQYVSLILYL